MRVVCGARYAPGAAPRDWELEQTVLHDWDADAERLQDIMDREDWYGERSRSQPPLRKSLTF